MAYRRVTVLLKRRREAISDLSSHIAPTKFHDKSNTLLSDQLVAAASSWGATETLQGQRQQRRGCSVEISSSRQQPRQWGSLLHYHSSRYGSSFSQWRSTFGSSQGSRERLDMTGGDEDQCAESDKMLWKDEGDDFAEVSGDSIPETEPAMDRVLTGSSVSWKVTTGGLWNILRAPADCVVVLVDGLHTFAGAPLWLTIIGSTLVFRTALFPFTITYMRKAAQFASSLSLLPPIRPPADSKTSLAEQYRIFTKRRLELGVPSPFWATAGLLQTPLFLYWIIALRGMAMNHHPGFESGGALWFVDLTVPVHGALGALFPSMVALTHFLNVQVSFRALKPHNNQLTGLLMNVYKWWLEAVTIPLFIIGFYLPQGVFMYWLTNNCFNLAQSLALQNDGFRVKVGLPSLSELEKLRSKRASQPVHADSRDLHKLEVDTLLSSATSHVIQDRDEEALKFLEFLVKKHPEEVEAYNVYGMLHLKKQQWSEASEYYSLAISKAKDDSQRITAFMGAGISLYNLGQKQEAISVMKPLVDIEVPWEPVTRQKYLRALVTLGSALSQEGLKEEALSVLELAVKWDRSIEIYTKQLQEDLDKN